MTKKLTAREEMHRSFRVCRWLLHSCFFYPPKISTFLESTTLVLKLMWVMRWFYIVVETVSSMQEVLFLKFEAENVKDIVDCLATCIPDTITAYIMITLYYGKDKYTKIQNILYDYVENADKVTEDIVRTEGKKYVVICLVFYFFTGVTMLCYLAIPFYINWEKSRSNPEYAYEKILPFHSVYPLPKLESPQYYLFFMLEMVRGVTLVQVLVGNDCLYIGTLMMVSAFFKILCKNLEKMNQVAQENVEKKLNGNVRPEQAEELYEKEMVHLMKVHIKSHKQLLDLCETIEDGFTGFIFYHLAVHALTLCVVGNQLLTVMNEKDVVNSIKYVEFINALLFELILYGYFGSELIDASEKVAVSVFQCGWHTTKGKELKNLVMIMMARAQKPCQVTAMGFAVMSLETVVTVLSTAGSYFTLLQSVKEQTDN